MCLFPMFHLRSSSGCRNVTPIRNHSHNAFVGILTANQRHWYKALFGGSLPYEPLQLGLPCSRFPIFFTHFPGWEGFGGPLMLIPGGLLWNKRRPMAELAPGLSNGPYKLVWRHLTQTIPDTSTLTHVCIIAHAVFWGHLAPHASFRCEVRLKFVTMVACIAHFTWTNDMNMWPLTAWPPPKI